MLRYAAVDPSGDSGLRLETAYVAALHRSRWLRRAAQRDKQNITHWNIAAPRALIGITK
jgi:hypothetical protein